jgi:hypothetical protein
MKAVFAFVCWFLFLAGQVYAGGAAASKATSAAGDEGSETITVGTKGVVSAPAVPADADNTVNTEPAAVTPDEAEPAGAPAVTPAKMEKPRAAEPTGYKADGFIAPLDWQGDGIIVSDKDKKLMISDGDTVFVNLGLGQVSPGTTCTVYRRLKKVKNPEDGNKLGIEVRLLGSLEITNAIGKDSSTAKVTAAREPIEIGDIVSINN